MIVKKCYDIWILNTKREYSIKEKRYMLKAREELPEYKSHEVVIGTLNRECPFEVNARKTHIACQCPKTKW